MRRAKVFDGFISSPEEQLEEFLNRNFISKHRVISISYAFNNNNRPHILLVYEDD